MKYNLKNFRTFDDAGEAYKWKEGFEAELRDRYRKASRAEYGILIKEVLGE